MTIRRAPAHHRMSDRDVIGWLRREIAWHQQMLEAHETVASSDRWQQVTGEIMSRARRALIRELETAKRIAEDRLAEAAY